MRSRRACRRSAWRSRASTIPPTSSARSGRAHRRGRQASQRRQAAGHPGRGGEGCAAARGGLRRAERARGPRRRVRAARHLHSRLEDHAREEAGARRRLERHDVLGGGAGAFRGSRRHHRAARRHGEPRRRALRRGDGPRRSGVRGEADAEPAGLHRRARHRPRSRRCRPRHPEAGEGHLGRRGRRPVSCRDQARVLQGNEQTPVPCSRRAASRA